MIIWKDEQHEGNGFFWSWSYIGVQRCSRGFEVKDETLINNKRQKFRMAVLQWLLLGITSTINLTEMKPELTHWHSGTDR